jgi:DNA-binding LytR/AlgR family response regulator
MSKILIVEDEQHSAKMLKGMVENLRPQWQILTVLDSISSTVDWLSSNPSPDLIFMDIQLTDGLCFSIFDKLKVSSMVVFTTAYDEYAIKAFQVNSIDYLLKPVKETLLEKSIQKFEELNKVSNPIDYQDLIHLVQEQKRTYRQRFVITGSQSFFKLDTKDIAYFYIVKRVCFAVTFKGKEHIVDFNIEKLEQELDPNQFFRANRSEIINIDAIDRFESFFGGKLNLSLLAPLKIKVSISRLRANDFKSWIDR